MGMPMSDLPENTPGTEVVQFRPRNSLATKVTYAKYLAESGLLPANYRKQPANVLYSVEYGEMVGISPLAAMIGVHVIDGKPTASAALMSALVRKAGHKLQVRFDRKTMTARTKLIRSDDPGEPFEAEWDLERAVDARLCTIDPKTGKPHQRTKKGEPGNWEKYPISMLKARAISEVCRDGAEECLLGLHYTAEELGAEVDEDGIPTTTVEQVRTEQRGGDLRDSLDIDWDAAIEKCGSNRDALLKLYHQAPAGPVKERILKLGKELKAKEEASAEEQASATPAEPMPEVVDAEIVEEPAAEPVLIENPNAAKLFDALLDASHWSQVEAISKQITSDVKFARADVSGWFALQPVIASLLKVKSGEVLTLSHMSALVAQYVEDNCKSINDSIRESEAEVA